MDEGDAGQAYEAEQNSQIRLLEIQRARGSFGVLTAARLDDDDPLAGE